MLRFGTNESPDHSKPILNYQSIAKMIKLPVTTVIELVKAAIEASRYRFKVDKPRRHKLSKHHIGYLVS